MSNPTNSTPNVSFLLLSAWVCVYTYSSEVLVEQCMESGAVLRVDLHGRLSNGVAYHVDDLTNNNHPLVVGTKLETSRSTVLDHQKEWWVKTPLNRQRNTYLLNSTEGFRSWNCIAKV